MENYQHTYKEKQEFLRKSIFQAGFDTEQFINYMGSVKNEGQNIDLNIWSMEDLQLLVQTFKIKNKNNFEATQVFKFNSSRLQQISSIMQSRMSVLLIKPKQVKYCLEDYDINNQKKNKSNNKVPAQITDQQMFGSFPCQKVTKPFRLSSKKNIFKINCQKFQIVQNPGMIFGIGAYKDIWITLNTNFTDVVVKRKIQDFQFLKNLLKMKFPGLMLPPLKNLKKYYFNNKDQISEQVIKVMNFMNDITKNEILFQNVYIEKFLTQTNYKKFQSHKARNQSKIVQNIKSSVCQIQSVSGGFQVQISDKIQGFMRNVRFLQENYQNCYTNVYKSFSKVKQHLKKASLEMTNVIGSYEVLEAFLNKIHSILDGVQTTKPNSKSQNEMSTSLYTYINQFQKNLKSNFNQIQEFMDNYESKVVKKSHQILEQFSNAVKNVRQSRKAYLQKRIDQLQKLSLLESNVKVEDKNLTLWQGYLNSNLVYSFYYMQNSQKQILNALLQKYFKKLSVLEQDRSKIFSRIQAIPKNDSYSRILQSYMNVQLDESFNSEQKLK